MAGTGRTAHYSIPIYNAGDTVNDLNTYNNAMEIIDTEMDTINAAGEHNSDLIATLNTQVQKAQGDITGLQNAVNNAQGTANGALAQIQEIVTPVTAKFEKQGSPVIGGPVTIYMNDTMVLVTSFVCGSADSLPSITIGGSQYYILAKADNQDAFRLAVGYIYSVNCLILVHRTQGVSNTIYSSGVLTMYYDGVNTYLLSNIDWSTVVGNDNVNYITYSAIAPLLINRQPKGTTT